MDDLGQPPSVGAEDLDALRVGVELLGSGGGGDPFVFTEILRRSIGTQRVALHPPEALADGLVVPVGVVGANSALYEKLPGGGEMAAAAAAVSRWSGLRPSAVMSIEAGGLNGITALVAALDLGLPCLDADLMGRAFPRLDQFSWAVEGPGVTPSALVAPGGDTVVIDHTDASGLERAVRGLLGQTGGWAAFALPIVPVAQAARRSVTGSLSRALRLGRAHATLPTDADAELIATRLGGRVIGCGPVRGVTRHGRAAGFRGTTITVVDRPADAVIRLDAENEFLLALIDGVPYAHTPDLIVVLDRRNLRPIAVETVRVGNEVLVLSLPGRSWWRASPRRAAAVGLPAFGLAASGFDGSGFDGSGFDGSGFDGSEAARPDGPPLPMEGTRTTTGSNAIQDVGSTTAPAAAAVPLPGRAERP